MCACVLLSFSNRIRGIYEMRWLYKAQPPFIKKKKSIWICILNSHDLNGSGGQLRTTQLINGWVFQHHGCISFLNNIMPIFTTRALFSTAQLVLFVDYIFWFQHWEHSNWILLNHHIFNLITFKLPMLRYYVSTANTKWSSEGKRQLF